ncbi:acyl carrier protein [Chitinophaga pendula]|uniref:acyl carrier protein n=1 Tax=Chitinophaga TaxID=79328 RepID=UPI000BB09CC6|nr:MULTISPECIES: acyl carrier protein [Chitinophaga]ASZ09698.1 hypothetical protein CK934_01265 [Chitinophaga sp. MD30]UCJ07362.1 acyl carrier protein [Chitinophaga pendula]
MKDKIIQAIENVTGEPVNLELANSSTNLLVDLGLNSLNLMQFIVELEKAFDIELDIGALDLATFDSLDAIGAFVAENQQKHA